MTNAFLPCNSTFAILPHSALEPTLYALAPRATHRVLFCQHRLEEAGVRVEARRVQYRVVGLVEVGDLALQLRVDVLGAADEAHRAQPEAVGVERLTRERTYQKEG